MNDQKLSVMPSEMLIQYVRTQRPDIQRPMDLPWKFLEYDAYYHKPLKISAGQSVYGNVYVNCGHWMRLAGGIGELQEESIKLARHSIEDIDSNPVLWIVQCPYCNKIHWWADPMLRGMEVDVFDGESKREALWYHLEFLEIERETQDALLIRTAFKDRERRKVWVPKSQIERRGKDYSEGDLNGSMCITEWFAKKEGLT